VERPASRYPYGTGSGILTLLYCRLCTTRSWWDSGASTALLLGRAGHQSREQDRRDGSPPTGRIGPERPLASVHHPDTGGSVGNGKGAQP